MTNPLVQDTHRFEKICEQISAADKIALDTEFIRQRTFQPNLCLIQIAVDADIYCLDPLALDNLHPLLDALASTRTIIHSSRQDLEAIYLTCERMLTPVYDTQIAAGLVGMGEQISYSALVKELLNVDLGKGETRTNWAQRPLTEAQIKYAEDDVRYLLALYDPLHKLLVDNQREHWHVAECVSLGDPALYQSDPLKAWKKVKGTRHLSREQRRIMKRLAAWRETQAVERDKPRKWIMSDADIVSIAAKNPQSTDGVIALLDEKQRYLRTQAGDILEQVKLAENDPVEEKFSGTDEREVQFIKKCMNQIKRTAEEQNISPGLLGTRKDVINLIRGQPSNLSKTWREELVGRTLRSLIRND